MTRLAVLFAIIALVLWAAVLAPVWWPVTLRWLRASDAYDDWLREQYA